MIELQRTHLEDTEKNKELYNELRENKDTEFLYDVSPTNSLYRIDDDGLLFCLNTEINQVTFMMQYDFSNRPEYGYYINELEVWSNPEIDDIKDIDKKLFFNYLIKYFEIAVIESKGDWDGKRFWLDCIMLAFKSKLNVYYVDFSTKETKRIESLIDWGRFVGSHPQIWIKGLPDEIKRVIITTRYLN
jgi:hypothetical protein